MEKPVLHEVLAGLAPDDRRVERVRFLAEVAHFMVMLRWLDGARDLYRALMILQPQSGFVDVQLALISWLEGRPEAAVQHARAAMAKPRLNAGELAFALGLEGAARHDLSLRLPADERETQAIASLFDRARQVGRGTDGGRAAAELQRVARARRNGSNATTITA